MKIFSQAPCRLSLFGGGTDVEPYASIYGGLCINMAINIRQKFTFDDEILPEPAIWYREGRDEKFYKAFLDEFSFDKHWIQIFDGKLEAGLGSSASAAVALVGGLARIKGINLSKKDIADKAWDIEVNKIGLFGGKQDQYCSALGGFNVLNFDENGVLIMSLSRNWGEFIYPYLVLFYLGKNRQSATIQEGFKNLTSQQIDALHKIKEIAEKGFDLISQGKIKEIGELLDESYFYKKQSNKGVSDDEIDEIYEAGIEVGAYGGKIMGAGGGGHMVFICPLDKREKLVNKMAELGVREIDFSIDWNGVEVRRL